MQLLELLEDIPYELVGEDVLIEDITYDSRSVRPGSLFIAIKGFKVDGHDFVMDAVTKGAAAVVVERVIPDLEVSQVVVADSRVSMGHIAAAFYGKPAQHLRLIGVTGTNGKTTTTYLIKSILEEAGYRVGLIGTIQTLIGQDTFEASRTTPESLDLQRILARMLEAGTEYVVMEVSSHALALHRTVGLAFDLGVFTNLTQDHLDFHLTFEDYFAAKAKLFKTLAGVAVINYDDDHGLNMAAQSRGPVVSYGVEQPAQVSAHHIHVSNTGVSYLLVSPYGERELKLDLTGYFNVYNSLAAAGACLVEGVGLDIIKRGLEAVMGVPGRFESIENEFGFGVIVDYAHTPDGLENILRTARQLTKGRVILVFGAGGDRDKGKRPLMGRIAAELADVTIITSDNPRSEDPVSICGDIELGFREASPGGDCVIVPDRREAIRYAISTAEDSDIVLIAGKGHETYQEFKNTKIHFDDREEAIAAIKELKV